MLIELKLISYWTYKAFNIIHPLQIINFLKIQFFFITKTVTFFEGYKENLPLENSHLEKSHPSNSPLGNSPWKISIQKIPTQNIPTYIFKHFVFSLLLQLSLIMVNRLHFCVWKMLKLELMLCIKKYLAACLLLRKYFGYDRNVFHIFIQEIFNFSKIGGTKKKFLKNPKKLVKSLSACLKQLYYSIHVTTSFYRLHLLLWARLYSPCLFLYFLLFI